MRKTLFLLVLAALAAPLFADDAPSATFFIERIEVRNARRVSPDVVIAESRLREGQEYSEDALRDAATRLSRLPFLLSVDFALEKGSERGRHVLVLAINETKPFFYMLDIRPFFENEYVEIDYSDRIDERGNDAALGFRWFVGRRGAFHVGFIGGEDSGEVRQEYASLAVGYTQYDLFGTRGFATLNLKKPVEGRGNSRISPQLVVGMPLSANQTLTFEYDEARFDRETVSISGQEVRGQYGQRFLNLRWSYNTTNDPFLPTSGTLLHVTPFVGWADGSTFYYVAPGDEVFTVSYHESSRGLETGAARYWEVGERESIFGDVSGWWAREELRTSDVVARDSRESRGGSIGVGASHSFWDRSRRASGDSRVELTMRFANRLIPSYAIPNYRPARDVRQASVAWVRRSSWGTLRLGAGYAW